MKRDRYNVIVIGGGHAGVEAAWAAANMFAAHDAREMSAPPPADRTGHVALITLDPAKIGVMSCNPAIGGLAKGQIVREIDAMGGLMGIAADATGIHFKMLNTSKGPAVHGPRTQNDKHAYAEVVQRLVRSRHEIDVITGAVEAIDVRRGPRGGGGDASARGVTLRTPNGPCELRADAVVLTTGTFMRGLMHTGDDRTPGGRHGEAPASAISAALTEMGFELGRLKTGTPPRLRKGSLDWEGLEPQHGDASPVPFSMLSGRGVDGPRRGSAGGAFSGLEPCPGERFPVLPQVECRQTRTSTASHDAIRANLHRAPMYSGQIESSGPRYCPSIEDKVVRFADRDSHGVFLEPESLRSDWIYCNGISSSLPADVQDIIVRSMPGCEHAEILQYGYAVEYDMVRPHQIAATCQTKRVAGLFLAGQINGTSGYEEAAAQGLIAGINAARLGLGLDADFTLARDEAYTGVLMDDLVTKTPVEPYRMFTSRAEHRLLLRADNAPDRLTPIAKRIGLLDGTEAGRRRIALFEGRRREIDSIASGVSAERLEREILGADSTPDGLRASLPGVRASADAWFTAWADARYEPYLKRQRSEIKRLAVMDRRRVPAELDYAMVDGLRSEARDALARFRPETFGQAGRLEGVTPADVTLLLVHKERVSRARRAEQRRPVV
ncbi:MAG: FAD-dependent oxidoreductase [Planctomycetota bacterium]